MTQHQEPPIDTDTPATSGEAQAPELEVYEGMVIDKDTGEALGIVLADGSYSLFADQPEGSKKWEPTTKDDLEWMLERRSHLAFRIAAVKLQAEAVLQRLEKLQQAKVTDFEKFSAYFDPLIVQLARQHFPKGKKTYQSPWGEVKTTDVGPKLQPLEGFDEELRMKWAKANAPMAVVQKPAPAPVFQISLVPKEVVEKLKEDAAFRIQAGYVLTAPTQKAEVKS